MGCRSVLSHLHVGILLRREPSLPRRLTPVTVVGGGSPCAPTLSSPRPRQEGWEGETPSRPVARALECMASTVRSQDELGFQVFLSTVPGYTLYPVSQAE